MCPNKKNNRKNKGCQKEANKPLGVLQTFLLEKKNTEKVTGNGKQKQIMIQVRKKAMD